MLTNKRLTTLNQSLLTNNILKILKHLAWTFLGTTVFVGIALTLMPLTSFLQLWSLTLSFKHQLAVSYISILLSLVAFLSGSWAIGNAVAHSVAIILTKATRKYAPN